MDQQAHILFVDDEQMLHALFQRLFSRHGLTVTCCSNGVQAVEMLKEESFDLVVTDFMMPDMDGTKLLSHIRQEYPQLKVIMITAHANVQQAVRVMKTGAIDYIPKPFSTTELLERVQKCLDEPMEQPAPKPVAKRRKKTVDGDASAYIGEHASLQELRNLLPLLSANDAPVFIQGESGTGKEVLSKQIHQMSKRSGGPFVAINCANLPRELVREPSLRPSQRGLHRGHRRHEREPSSAPTAVRCCSTKSPKWKWASRLSCCACFKNASSTRWVRRRRRRRTSALSRPATAISAKPLPRASSARTSTTAFASFLSRSPPLRERVSDVPLLVDHFIDKYCTLYGLPPKTISADLLRQFQLNSWPGNVRQLENMVQRGVLISADRATILPEDVVNDFFADADLQAQPRAKESSITLQTIDDMERHMILQALDDTGNNQQLAADRLGISARTIRNKLRRYREEGIL